MENKPILHVRMSKEIQRNWKATQHVADRIKDIFGSTYKVVFTPNWGSDANPSIDLIPDNSTIVNLEVRTEKDIERLIEVLDKIPEEYKSDVDKSPTNVYTYHSTYDDIDVNMFRRIFSKYTGDDNKSVKVRVGTTGKSGSKEALTILDFTNLHNFNMLSVPITSIGNDGVCISLRGNDELDIAIEAFEFIVKTLKEKREENDNDIPYNPNSIHGREGRES